MDSTKTILKSLSGIKNRILKISLKKKLTILAIIMGIGWFGNARISAQRQGQPQYQTAQAERGTLTVVVSASGQVSQTNSATVDTQTSGVVSRIFVDNGQKVKVGDKIAEIELDLVGKQRASGAYSNYQSAKNSLETAKINYYTLQSDMLTKWKAYMDIAQSSLYQNSDKSPKIDTRQLPDFMISNDEWLATEAKYKNQKNVFGQLQSALNSAWLSYQQTSSTVYAPISGTVTGFSLQIGSVLTSQSNTSGTATAQKIASIQTTASPLIKVNLTQIDTPKVMIGNNATLLFDAFPGKTFTGKVISIDTIGAISSGVTTYPAVIKLDADVPGIFSNMTTQANIITQIRDDVLLVPQAAVQSQSGQSLVRVMQDGKVTSVQVEIGDSNDTKTEILSGIIEGEIVVIGQTNPTTGSAGTTNNSPFGSTRGGFGGPGGFGGAGGQRR